MALPTPTKTWQFAGFTKNLFVSNALQNAAVLLSLKNYWKAATGVTVKGSSDGTTAAMDGTDRLVVATDFTTLGASASAAQSWIVLTCTGLGGTDILITYQGSLNYYCKIAFSPGGLYTVAATATFQPTATDEQVVTNTGIITNLASDKFSCPMRASDGSALRVLVASNGAFDYLVTIQTATPTVTSPATFSPAVIGVRIPYASASSTGGTSSSALFVGKVNGISATMFTSFQGYKSGSVTSQQLKNDLQGGLPITPIGLYSNTTSTKGRVGTLIDLWWTTNFQGGASPRTIPAATRTFLKFGVFLLPWDGSIPVVR